MTTVTKTFTFDTGSEKFTDPGGTLAGAYTGADGSPSAGCWAFTGDPGGGATGSAILECTWEDLGVWPGGTVTAAECTAYKINSDNAGYLEATILMTGAAYASIMPAALAASAGTITGPTGWVTGDGLNGSQTLTASKASRTAVIVVIEIYSDNVGASVFKFDTITFLITFTGGINPVRPTAAVASNRAYTRVWRRGETG